MGEPMRRELVAALATVYELELPAGRLEQLAETFGDFISRFAPIWEIDPEDCEPQALTFEDEAPEA